MVKLRGVIGPVVTTFQASTEDVHREAFATNVRAHMAAGLHGIVVAGSTGEAALLDERERGILLETARELVPGDRLLLAGAGAESTRTAVRLARDAAQRGANAVLVVAPHYYGSAMTEQALTAHYRRLADASPIPVVLYNIPKYMHFALTPALVGVLAAHENIIGIKDSSGDLALLSAYLESQSDRFSVMTGSAQTFAAAIAAGARGGVLAVSLFAPALTFEVFEAAMRGDAGEAGVLQARLKPVASRIVGELGVPGVKKALDLVGLMGGVVRSPLQALSAAEAADVTRVLETAGVPGAASTAGERSEGSGLRA